MNETFELSIRTPNEDIFTGDASGLKLSTEGGDMEVFANHASVTASLMFSPIVVDTGDKQEEFVARNGLFLFDNASNRATILTLNCEKKSEVSHQTVQEYLQFINKQLAEGADLSDFQILYLKGEKLAVEEQMEELQ